jgi:dTDP-4-dehydrorhamnose 3,5-epimerase-like enzyme
MIDAYLSITHLASEPPKMEGRQVGFVLSDKGETAYLNVNHASQTVMVIELLPGKIRGGHYHLQKEEWIYLIEGEAWGYFWLPGQESEARKVKLTKSDLVHIKPGLAHAYEGIKRSLALEQADFPYIKEQTVVATMPSQWMNTK